MRLILRDRDGCPLVSCGVAQRPAGWDDLVERYGRRSGRDVRDAGYYRAFGLWKTATVVQQIYVRFVRGQTHDPRFGRMGIQPPILARTAAEVVTKLGFRE